MKKQFILLTTLIALSTTGCAEMQQIAQQFPEIAQQGNFSQAQIASALKQALNQGVDVQVKNLTKSDGFYKNNLVKIGLPTELQKVEKGLRAAGLGSLADEGIKALNRAAENAVKEATPIFIDAITQMTITDASSILLGNRNAATQYLEKTTSKSLYNKFNPVIKNSFNQVGADQIWNNLIRQYNQLPMVQKVNPDLTDYVTEQALNGVYKMIEKEEAQIRSNISSRTTPLMKSVFAMQDKK